MSNGQTQLNSASTAGAEAGDARQAGLKVVVLYGGNSGEREVSLVSGRNVAGVLEQEGFDVLLLDTGQGGKAEEPLGFAPVVTALQDFAPDVVFIALHGKGGEDGSMQGLLELLGIPYTGSGILASSLAMDKERSKLFYRDQGLSVPPSICVRPEDALSPALATAAPTATTAAPAPQAAAAATATPATAAPATTIKPTLLQRVQEEVGIPCVVKPVAEGSSLGVYIVRQPEELAAALAAAFAISDELMIERFIQGREVTVSVLGNDEPWALPVIEIIPHAEFYDYQAKYAEGGSTHVCPAELPPAWTETCQRHAVLAHKALGCRGMSRTDFIFDAEGTPWVLESNLIPGMTGTSLLPDAARAAGLTAGQLYRKLIDYALE
ncbi:MAG: D-alanine--D-alanine ligase [Coriobacteriales bacterium]|jgi:D-alanine-D-alanine ligase|nr:D-alanine--D-alanine ligase [Coriobacteriales bacterium]